MERGCVNLEEVSFSVLRKDEVGSDVVCLLRINSKFFVRIVTGKEGAINEVYNGDNLEEAEKFFNEYIKK